MFRGGRQFNGNLLKNGPVTQHVSNATDVDAYLWSPNFVGMSRSVEEIYPMHLEGGATKWEALLASLIRFGEE